MYAQIDPVPHAADLVAKSTDCPLTRMRSTSVWGAPNDSTRSLTLAISDWKGQPVSSVHQRLPATGDPRDVRDFVLAAPVPVEGASSFGDPGSYRTAMVTVFERVPPADIITGTALPFADPAGTCAFI